MFGHNHTQLPYVYDYDYDYSPDLQTFPAPPLFLPPLAIPEHDSISALRSEITSTGYTSSGCSSYGGSPTSITSYGGGAYIPAIIPRSHSLHRNMEVYSPMNSSSPPTGGYLDCETSSVRKVLSAGDLQGVNMSQLRSSSPLVNESSIIESMNRANPYSPEEKKERIERYRNKRNLRNFNKKIKYECRKTLADSRPRIRGRFARNDEIDQIKTASQAQWDNTASLDQEDEYDQDDEDNWINLLDALSANLMP
ncbi:hypothetical protein ACS0TY_020935 [Phlomoides rotata]